MCFILDCVEVICGSRDNTFRHLLGVRRDYCHTATGRFRSTTADTPGVLISTQLSPYS